jgi:6-phosphogluconolactonase
VNPLVFSSPAELAGDFVRRTEVLARAAIAARGRFCCALTGGSTAALVYPVLAGADLDWGKVELFYGDERCVAPEHPDSNHRVALAALGRTGARFHPIDGTLPPDAAARAYEQTLLPLDVVHLGVGPDGHVASLFPGHRLLAEAHRRVAPVVDSPKPPLARVTLTLAALAEARSVWLVAMGAAKRDAVRAALGGASSSIPAALAQRAAAEALWFLDDAAASLLTV